MPSPRPLVLPALAALLPVVALIAPPAAPAGGARGAVVATVPSPATSALVPSKASTEPPGRAPRWLSPVDPPVVLRSFDPPDERWGAGHRGVDLRVAPGAPVRAPADGIVAFVGVVAGRAVLSVDHAGGLRSTYEPVAAEVPRGRHVRRGDRLGTLADPVHCAGGCLHWGVRRGAGYLDPMALVGMPPVVLLPLSSG